MREIKFRAWDKRTSKMFYSGEDQTVWAGGIEISVNSTKGKIAGDFIGMQFTGLMDKKLNEAFEGDVLGTLDRKDDPSRCVIVYKDAGFKRDYNPFLSDEDKEGDYYPEDFIHQLEPEDFEIWEVIGNIYQNPELI
jgi:uncharacterized phage protein (TIGR01671 family)